MRPRHEQQHPTRRSVLSSIQRSEAGSAVVSQPVARNQDTYGVPAGAHCRDWSTAGRIEGGQSAPRFGSAARNPLTGLGSNAWPVQFRDWSILPGALCGWLVALAASGLRVVTPVPSHGANERLGQFLITIRDHLLPVADSGNGILPLGRSRAHSQRDQHGVHRLADRHPALIALVAHVDRVSQA
jgi:hypothetical protein